MSDDIVARLRYLAETYSPLIMDSEWNEAADEIERLRIRLLAEENVSDIERIQNEHLQKDRNNLALEIERLTAERDDARVRFCLLRWVQNRRNDSPSVLFYAKEQGWDYLKDHRFVADMEERSAPE